MKVAGTVITKRVITNVKMSLMTGTVNDRFMLCRSSQKKYLISELQKGSLKMDTA